MRPNIKPIPAIVILLAISALSYSVLSGGAKELVHEQEVEIIAQGFGEFDLTVQEPNYVPLVFECIDGNDTEILNFSLGDGEIICSKPPKEAVEIIYKTFNGSYGSDKYDLPIRFLEPNEPEFVLDHENVLPSIDYMLPDEPDFCLQQYIPTWPDYIELKKDLVIHRPGKTKNEFIVSYFHKGTHIYFRDDDD